MSLPTQPGSTDLLLPIGERGDGTNPYTVHTYYFGFTIPGAGIGAYLYFRAQPAFGLCQGGPVIFRGMDNTELLSAEYHDYRATMPWPTIAGTTLTTDGGYVIDWSEPGRLARLRYRSPDGAVSFDMEQRAITPLIARGHIVPGEDDHHSGAGRQSGGSEQFMHVTGELNLRGERLDIDCLHVRDRSWNQVRTEEPGGARPHPPLGWTPVCFGEDLALQTTSIEPEDTDPAWKGLYTLDDGAEPFFNSWVVRNGEPRKLVSVRRTVHRYHPVLHSAVEQELEAVDETGERYHLHGEALAQTPMHSWPNIAFRDSVYRWTDLLDSARRVTYCTYQEIFYDAYFRGPRHVR